MSQIAYLFSEGGLLKDENGNLIYDRYGDPVEIPPQPNIPFALRSWQPYGPQSAYNRYGLGIEVNSRFFCDPDERLTLNKEFVYKNKQYKITWVLPYEQHYEVMVKLEGTYSE